MDHSIRSTGAAKDKYAKVMVQDTLSVEGQAVTFEDISRCYSKTSKANLGVVVSFLNRLSVLWHKGVWLNDHRIEAVIGNSDNVDKLIHVSDRIKGLRQGIAGFKTTIVKSQEDYPPGYAIENLNDAKKSLEKMERRLARVAEMIKNQPQIKEALQKRDAELVAQQQKVVSPPIPSEQQTIGQKLDHLNNNLGTVKKQVATENQEKQIRLLDVQHQRTDKTIELVTEVAKEATGIKPGRVIEEAFVKVIGLKNNSRLATDNVISFLQDNAMASNEGLRLLKNLDPESKMTVQRYLYVKARIAEMEAKPDATIGEKIKAFMTETLAIGESLEELKKELGVLEKNSAIIEIQRAIQSDHIGKAFPMAFQQGIGAIHRHLNGLTTAIMHLRGDYPYFDQLPPNCKDYLIMGEMARLQQKFPEIEVVKTPIKPPERTPELAADILRILNTVRDNVPLTPETKEMLRVLDDAVGKQINKSNAITHEQLDTRTKNVLLQIFFPDGAIISSDQQNMLKLAGIDLNKIVDKIASRILEEILVAVGTPFTLNSILEPFLTKQLETLEGIQALKDEIAKKKSEAPLFSGPNREIIKMEEQLSRLEGKKAQEEIDINLMYHTLQEGREDATTVTPRGEFENKYRDMSVNIIKLIDPKYGKALHQIDQKYDQRSPILNHVVEAIQSGVRGSIDGIAMAFDEGTIADILEAPLALFFDKNGKYIPGLSKVRPKVLPTKEQEAQLDERVKDLIVQVSKKKVEAITGKEKDALILGKVIGEVGDYVSQRALELHELSKLPSANRILTLELLTSLLEGALEMSGEEKS